MPQGSSLTRNSSMLYVLYQRDHCSNLGDSRPPYKFAKGWLFPSLVLWEKGAQQVREVPSSVFPLLKWG